MKKLFFIPFIVIFALSTFTAPTQAQGFSDVSSENRFYEFIFYLSDEDVISGFPDGSFRPKKKVTRADVAIMIGRTLGLDGTQRDTKFPDVGVNQKASGYIAAAVDKGIISGFHDGTYRPDEPVTRGQMAILINRAFYLVASPTNTFDDMGSYGLATFNAVSKLAGNGISLGYPDNTYRPNQAITREQFSAFMAKILEPAFVKEIARDYAQVAFLDVGQGDSILITYPNGKNMLIDAGRSDSDVVEELQKLRVTQIDTFVATHPDDDHIGGADKIIKDFNVQHVIDSGQEHTTDAYLDYLDAVKQSGATFEIAEIGDDVSLDISVSNKVLHVDRNSSDINDGSIVLQLEYMDARYLLTGDAGTEVEEKLIDRYNLQSDILKVSNHGSNTSTSQSFLDEVNPNFSVISHGEGNPYNSEVLERLQSHGTQIVTTLMNGTLHSFIDNEGSIFIGDLMYFDHSK